MINEQVVSFPGRDAAARERPPGCPALEGVRHGFVPVQGARLHYVEAGRGQPLVLLHGWPQHWWSYRHVIGALAADYRVIVPDLRGLGWSEGSARGYRFLDLAADVVSLLDALRIQRARLVGHDWGLAVGYTTCLQWPERVLQYVALGGVTLWSGEGWAWPGLFCRAWHISALALFGHRAVAGLARHALSAWRHVGQFTREEQQVYLDPLRTPHALRATVRYYRTIVMHELPFFLRHYASQRLRTKALHLNGAHDPLTFGVPDNYRRYAHDMRLEQIPDCGHFIAEERPALLVEKLRDFFG